MDLKFGRLVWTGWAMIGLPGTALFGAAGGGAPAAPAPPPSSSASYPAPHENALHTRPMTGEEWQKIRDAGQQQGGNMGPRDRPLRMVFPANPPPLGAQINASHGAAIPADPAIAALLGEPLEPYFAPLSTRIIESDYAVNRRLRTRLEAYRESRLRLLTDLRERIAVLMAGDSASRREGFVVLAREQQAGLERLEAEAEELRSALARNISWFAKRRWRLGLGELSKPRSEIRVPEYQVLRAAAYYQEGLSPGQRRLAREASQLLEASVFAAADPSPSPPLLFFFSPDLLRMQFPVRVSPEVAAQFRQFTLAKDALREQVRDAIFTGDTVIGGVRARTMQRLAAEQEPQLIALETLAEAIREKLAATTSSVWRQPPPRPLPAGLEAQISAYLTRKTEVLMDYLAVMRSVTRSIPPTDARKDKASAEGQRQRRLEQARNDYLAREAGTMQELGRMLQEICAQLPEFLTADEVAFADASDDAQFLEFVSRHRREQAYFEYDIAAFEPGLSPAQRRLLFAGAVARFELPFVGPEVQPVVLPKTFLR